MKLLTITSTSNVSKFVKCVMISTNTTPSWNNILNNDNKMFFIVPLAQLVNYTNILKCCSHVRKKLKQFIKIFCA